jgi:hypothetical protein
MNDTESFEQFATRVTPLDLALYAGLGLVLWVLFKDRLSPVQKIISDLIAKIKGDKSTVPNLLAPVVSVKVPETQKEDVFFQLIASWKQTRDLALKSECDEAIKSLDQTFPYLSPTACGNKVVPSAKSE